MKHRETVARRKLGADHPDFKFFRFECVGTDAVMLTGCVSSGVYTKGKRVGRPRYDGTPQVAVVTDAEAIAEHARYEAETGNCGHCCGEGREFAGWHHIDGTKWRECKHCHGTGRLEQIEAQQDAAAQVALMVEP